MRHRLATSLKPDLMAALPPWLVARILVGVAFVLAIVISDELAPGNRPSELDDGLLSWDGEWYRDIARLGYGELPREALRFFPLFPVLGRLLSPVVGGSESFALVLISNGFALAVGMAIHRLVLLETGDPALARRATWLMALFPSAFVLVWGYSESLMLTAVIGAFVALRRGNWWWAAALGLVAGLARPLGLMLTVPALIEAGRGVRGVGLRNLVPRAAAVAGPAVGTLVYLVYSWVRFDDFFEPFSVQEDFRGDAQDPITRLFEGAGELFGSDTFGDGLHLPFALGFVVLLIVVFRRLPLSYGAYAATVLLVALSADNLNSLERYGLNAFPLVIALAYVAGRDERLDRAAFALCGAGLVSLATLALVGSYVP